VWRLALIVAALVSSTAIAEARTRQAADEALLKQAVQRETRSERGSVRSYQVGWTDLNGDGRPDAIIRLSNSDYCGSGGCDLKIYERTAKGFKSLGSTSITQWPIKVLDTHHRGRRDISVYVEGGGVIRGYTARLQFDGRSYPPNASVPPARPMKHSPGRTLIDHPTPSQTLD
jgi:hypothetical protein